MSSGPQSRRRSTSPSRRSPSLVRTSARRPPLRSLAALTPGRMASSLGLREKPFNGAWRQRRAAAALQPESAVSRGGLQRRTGRILPAPACATGRRLRRRHRALGACWPRRGGRQHQCGAPPRRRGSEGTGPSRGRAGGSPRAADPSQSTLSLGWRCSAGPGGATGAEAGSWAQGRSGWEVASGGIRRAGNGKSGILRKPLSVHTHWPEECGRPGGRAKSHAPQEIPGALSKRDPTRL